MTAAKQPAPPQISPYVFPVLLAGFGLWCLYDGWISVDPEMLKHQTFNRIASGVLLLWAGLDFIRTRRQEKAEAEARANAADAASAADAESETEPPAP